MIWDRMVLDHLEFCYFLANYVVIVLLSYKPYVCNSSLIRYIKADSTCGDTVQRFTAALNRREGLHNVFHGVQRTVRRRDRRACNSEWGVSEAVRPEDAPGDPVPVSALGSPCSDGPDPEGTRSRGPDHSWVNTPDSSASLLKQRKERAGAELSMPGPEMESKRACSNM